MGQGGWRGEAGAARLAGRSPCARRSGITVAAAAGTERAASRGEVMHAGTSGFRLRRGRMGGEHAPPQTGGQ